MSSAVRVTPQDGQSLGFDLKQVMNAVGRHDDLVWHMSGASLVSHDDAPDTWQVLADRSNDADGVPITWEEMAQLAEDCVQVIDGTFTGQREGALVLALEAIDSSFWIVRASDVNLLDRVRQTFNGVEDYPEGQRLPCG